MAIKELGVFHAGDETRMVAWSPLGNLLACGDTPGNVTVWDVATGRIVYLMRESRGAVQHIAWRPDGRYIASALQNGDVRVWDVRSGEFSAFLPSSGYVANCVEWSPDGERVVSGHSRYGDYPDSYSVKIWDVCKRTSAIVVKDKMETGTLVTWSPDGTRIACTDSRNRIQIIDSRSYKVLHMLHDHEQRILCLQWTADSKSVLSGSLDCRILLWDLGTESAHEIHREIMGGIQHLSLSPDGESLFVSHFYRGGNSKIIRTADGMIEHRLSADVTNDAAVWSPQGDRIAMICEGGVIRIRQAEAWRAKSRKATALNSKTKDTAVQIARSVLRDEIPSGVLADFLEEYDCDLTGHQVQHLRVGNLYPAGCWAGCQEYDFGSDLYPPGYW